ncbi:MAG: hypothetical protein ACYC0H_23920 [Solirubrobacteraceae bacterium]
MTISSRYLSSLALILGAGFLVVATQAFAPITVAWLTFAIAAGAAFVGMWMIFGPTMTVYHRVLGGLVGVLSAWTIVASLVFLPATVLWLGFASAIGFVALGVGGLTAHELTAERVIHALEIEHKPAREPAGV